MFAVGADIGEFGEITPDRARLGGQAGHELFGRIRDLPFVTVAAINGAALGGGVEIALHCDYRTIASSVRHFACPEVFLGLIPGWGGTQLVPHLVGAEQAVTFVVENPLRQNRMLDARRAFEAGFADALVEPVEFLDESLAYLLEKVEEGAGKRRPAADLSDAAEVCRKARSRLDGQVHGATPAPYRALDLIEGSATWSLDEGYRAEEEALAELLPGPEAQASVYAFNLVERRAKRGVGMPDAEPRRVQRVGVVGAGLMARQLALLFLRRLEVPVVLRDLTREQVDEAGAWIADELGELVRRGRLAEGKARFLGSLVGGGTEWEVFADCDLVLEAVFEEMAVKKEVFAALEKVVSPECVLATNTSSLSVTEMGADLEHPERVVGMHFFNPVALLPLVELARTPQHRRHDARDRMGGLEEAEEDRCPRTRRTGVRREPSPRPAGVRRDAGARPRQHGRGDRRGGPADGPADGAVSAPAARRPEGREPRPAHAPRRVARALPTLGDPGEPRRRRRRTRGRGARTEDCRGAAHRRSRGACRRVAAHPRGRASSPRPRTSTPASSSAPVSRSGSAGSRSTSTRRAFPSAWWDGRSPRFAPVRNLSAGG